MKIAEMMAMVDEILDEHNQRARVVAEALTWTGTPWHHQGRVKGAGVDCGMFLAEVFERAGVIPHVDPGDYPPDWNLHRSEERYLGWVEKFAQRLPEGAAPRPGDIALFKFGRCVNHGAIVTSWPQIIHSQLNRGVPLGVMLDDAENNQELAPRLVGFWSMWAHGGEA